MSVQPPRDLALFVSVIEASDEPAVVMIDRALVRELLAYVRALECGMSGIGGRDEPSTEPRGTRHVEDAEVPAAHSGADTGESPDPHLTPAVGSGRVSAVGLASASGSGAWPHPDDFWP